MTYKILSNLLRTIALCALLASIFASCNNPSKETKADAAEAPAAKMKPSSVTLVYCYANEFPLMDKPKLKDMLELEVRVEGDKVEGTYNWMPHEKDKRIGKFIGTIKDKVVQAKYSYEQEGETQTTDLQITLKKNEAVVAGNMEMFGLPESILKVPCK